jgi:hypothetical protein
VDKAMDQWEGVKARKEVEVEMKEIFLKMTRLSKGKGGGRKTKTRKKGGKGK